MRFPSVSSHRPVVEKSMLSILDVTHSGRVTSTKYWALNPGKDLRFMRSYLLLIMDPNGAIGQSRQVGTS